MEVTSCQFRLTVPTTESRGLLAGNLNGYYPEDQKASATSQPDALSGAFTTVLRPCRYLRQFRRFYLDFREILPELDKRRTVFSVSAEEIRQTSFSEFPVSKGGQSQPSVSALLLQRFPLGWSHYVTLFSVADPDARRFYEIEAADNGWSVRELKRQLDSSLYERLALSRDKHEVRRLAREGQIVEKASGLIKDPVVLEFLGLEERPAYSESDLETAITDRLQQFLLELGKGCVPLLFGIAGGASTAGITRASASTSRHPRTPFECMSSTPTVTRTSWLMTGRPSSSESAIGIVRTCDRHRRNTWGVSRYVERSPTDAQIGPDPGIHPVSDVANSRRSDLRCLYKIAGQPVEARGMVFERFCLVVWIDHGDDLVGTGLFQVVEFTGELCFRLSPALDQIVPDLLQTSFCRSKIHQDGLVSEFQRMSDQE